MELASLQIRVRNDGTKEAVAQLAALQKESLKAVSSTDKLTAAQKKSEEASRKQASAIGGTLKNAVAGLASGFAALKAINMIDEFNQLQARVEQSTRSVQESTAVWAGLISISKETGASMAANVSIFQRLSLVRDEIKATTDEMLQFSETVSQLGVISGASQDSQKFGLTQLGQSLSSDIVRAEEFNSIMENIPSVGKAIADQLGVTTGQLRQLVIDGKLLSADVFSALLNASEETNKNFAEMPMTVGRAFSSFLISLQESLSMLDEASNLTAVLAGTLNIAADTLKTIAALFSVIAEVISTIGEMLYFGFLITIVKIKSAWAEMVDELSGGTIKIKATITAPDGTELTEEDIKNMGILAGAERGKKIAANINQGGAAVQNIYGNTPAPTATQSGTRKITTDYAGMVGGNKASDEAKKQADNIKKVTDNLRFQNEQMGRTNDEQELYNQLRSAGVTIDSAAGKGIEELVRQHQALEKQQNNVEKLTDSIGTGFEKMFKSATSGAFEWRDALSGILSDVQSMFYDLVVKNQLKELLGGVFGGGSSGSIGGSGIGSLLGSLGGSLSSGLSSAGNWLSSAFSGLTGFAGGGEFAVGGAGGTDSQLVAFRASPNETVSIKTPSQQGSGGGVVNTYHIDARGADMGVEERLTNALKQLDRSIEGRARNTVQTAMQRDPTYGRRN